MSRNVESEESSLSDNLSDSGGIVPSQERFANGDLVISADRILPGGGHA